MGHRIFLGFAATLASVAASALAVEGGRDAADVYGRWYTPNRDSIIEVRDCGDGTPCGRVVWLDQDTAEFLVDVNNRDDALRGQPMLGARMLSGFRKCAQGWRKGAIYNPRDGKTYRATLTRLDGQRLEIKGCVSVICKGQVWEAVPADHAGVDAADSPQ